MSVFRRVFAVFLVVVILAAVVWSVAVRASDDSDVSGFSGSGTQDDPFVRTVAVGSYCNLELPVIGPYTKYAGLSSAVSVPGVVFCFGSFSAESLSYPGGFGLPYASCVLSGVPAAPCEVVIRAYTSVSEVFYKVVFFEPTAWPLVLFFSMSSDGSPVPGVVATLVHLESGGVASRATGADGIADFGVVDGGDCVLSFAFPEGFVPMNDYVFLHRSSRFSEFVLSYGG